MLAETDWDAFSSQCVGEQCEAKKPINVWLDLKHEHLWTGGVHFGEKFIETWNFRAWAPFPGKASQQTSGFVY